MATAKHTERAMQQDAQIQQRRAAARKTAWVLAAIVVAIFTAFILSGVLGKA